MKKQAAAFVILVASTATLAQDPQYTETVTVVRYVISARVVDRSGQAIADLTPADFKVTIGGTAARVESAEWVGSKVSATGPGARPGRLLILFVQTDFGRDFTRMRRQLAFNPLADQLIDALEPTDLVAVFSHDSHLKLRQDFTLDRDAVRKAVHDSIRIERIPLPSPPATGPSLARLLHDDVLRKTPNSEAALLLIARTLRDIEGEKAIILAGWGLGTLHAGRVHMKADWVEAVTMLEHDRVPVITLGTGLEAQLTVGMMATARATSGFHASTVAFPQQVLTRVSGVLAGFYELVLTMEPPLAAGQHPIAIKVERRGTTVFAPKAVSVDDKNRTVADIMDVSESELGTRTRQELVSTLFVKAMREIQDGNTDVAVDLFTELTAIDGAPSVAWYELALLLAVRGELDAAAANLRKYLELEPRGEHARESRELLKSWTKPGEGS
jgi:hypothetical protein